MAKTPATVRLPALLALIESAAGNSYGEWIGLIQERFGCRERAAKDALAILVKAGYVVARPDERDRRVRRYWISDRGSRLLAHPRGPVVLAYARTLFTGCGRRPQPAQDEALAALRRCEELLVGALPLDLSGVLFADDQMIDWRGALPLPVVHVDPSLDRLQPKIHEPRCKVCRSPYRDEIDRRLAYGESQTTVRQAINAELGSDY